MGSTMDLSPMCLLAHSVLARTTVLVAGLTRRSEEMAASAARRLGKMCLSVLVAGHAHLSERNRLLTVRRVAIGAVTVLRQRM